MSQRAKRRKRDTATNLYNQCQITGNCPPDVKNKIEGTTWADQLLKWFGSIIYTGGLGIGTGRGTGGSTGYRPIGGTAGGGRVGAGGTVVRPGIALEPLGPQDILPVDVLDPTAPSVVPLSEGDPTLVVPEGGVGSGVEPTINVDPEVSVTTPHDPISDLSNTTGTHAVATGEEDVAILEVQPPPSGPKRVVTRTDFTNPAYHTVLSSSFSGDTSSAAEILVNAVAGGDVVGEGEYIELDLFSPREGGSPEPEAPKTSTPKDLLSRTLTRAKDLYNRRVRQLETRNPDFLGQAGRAVTFGFENPAFEDEVTLTFEQDVGRLEAAPDPDFADIIKLGRQRLSEVGRRVRASRLGMRGTITTRSGAQIGESVHFYYDISTIEPQDSLELSALGEHSGDASHVHGLAESTFIDSFNTNDPLFPQLEDEELLDTLTEDFSNSHLVLRVSGRPTSIDIPTLPPGLGLRVFVDDVGNGLFVSYPQTSSPGDVPRTIPDIIDTSDLGPTILSDFSSADFSLHPSWYRRKRKRSDQ